MKGGTKMGELTLPAGFVEAFGGSTAGEPPQGWLSAPEIASAMHCSLAHAQHQMRALRDAGRVRCGEFRPAGSQRRTWFYDLDSVKARE